MRVIYLYSLQEASVRGNVHILNVYILAGPKHKSALAEETVAKISLFFFFFFLTLLKCTMTLSTY